MNLELLKNESVFSLPLEKIDIEQTRALLEMFSFNIPEEQLPHIQLTGLEKYGVAFTNTVTGEECSAEYTHRCIAFGHNSSYPEADNRFLAQRIQGKEVNRVNYFQVLRDTDCYWGEYGEYAEGVFIPPYIKERRPLTQQAFFEAKTSDGNFVLHMSKDYPDSDKSKMFNVRIYKGTLDEVYKPKGFYKGKPDFRRQIIEIKYSLDKDYNFYQTGCCTNRGDLGETRYIYGRNMHALTDYSGSNNTLPDNRLVYSVDHNENRKKYSGVICEDGNISVEKRVHPLGIHSLCPPIKDFEKMKGKISKAYFQGYEQETGWRSVGIVKTKDGIKIAMDNSETDEKSYKINYNRIGEYDLPNLSEGIITVDEIQNIVNALREKAKNDSFVQVICNELEIFVERKLDRKAISEMGYKVSDICTPNLLVYFDFDLMANMVEKQGAANSIQTIIQDYCRMFKCAMPSVINCNIEIKDNKSLVL